MTTHKNTWKQLERRICKALGGKRTPLSGSNSQHGTSADCIEVSPEFQKYYFEIRMRQNFAHHTMFREDVEPPAKKEDKIPVLITHKKSSKSGALVILRMDDFLELIKHQSKQKKTETERSGV